MEQPMTSVFLSGSHMITSLNDAIRNHLDDMIDNERDVLVGDANGADKAMQKSFADRDYSRVTVYFVGKVCRNNVGNWVAQNIPVDPKLRGRHFYAQKDKAMAERADTGFVLWDGQSPGSLENILELVKRDKPVLVYFAPERTFYDVTDHAVVHSLLNKCSEDTRAALDQETHLDRY